MDSRAAMQRIPALAALDPPIRQRVAPHAVATAWATGERLWRPGEAGTAFLFVAAGRVRLRLPGARRPGPTLRIAEAGGLICGASVCQSTVCCCEAIALAPTTLLSIPREQLLDPDAPPSTRMVLRLVAEQSIAKCRRLREVTAARVSQRVTRVLLRQVASSGTPAAQGRQRLREVSREELASLCATSPETVTRTISLFERGDLVKREGHDLLVDVDRLARTLVGSDPRENARGASFARATLP